MSKTGTVLDVTYRDGKGKGFSRRIRRTGRVPAVVYGLGKDPKHLLLDSIQWKTLLTSQVQMAELKDDKGEMTNVLIKDYQYDYLSDSTLHVDFLEIDMNQIITSTVVIHSHGTAAGTAKGGILEQQLHELEVSCLPANLPESLEVDITELGIDESILVKDLKLPADVTAETDPDHIVFHVFTPTEEEEKPEGEEGAEGAEGEEGEGAEGAEGEDAEGSEE